ncbi:hypothetical protein Tco_0662944 [Tanacetum coccineum]
MEDTDNAHISKVSTTTWFKPIPESERPATPEPEWTIPPNDFPEPEHNWANAYATTFKVLEENKLQRKMYDIGSFIKWFCRRTRKKKLCKADLEGPAFNLVKAFHKNSVFLQYQMDECHKLLTNKARSADQTRVGLQREEDRFHRFRSAQPPPKMMTKGSKKQGNLCICFQKTTSSLLNDGKALTQESGAGYSMHRSDPNERKRVKADENRRKSVKTDENL